MIELIESFINENLGGNPFLIALFSGSMPMVLTAIGSIAGVIGAFKREGLLEAGMGFSAGVMITASFTSLILPGIEIGGVYPVLEGIIVGAIALIILERLAPHEHLLKGYEGPQRLRSKLKAVYMLVIAITIHNLPEGLAVGSAAMYDLTQGVIMALAIGFQDIPEGLAITLPLIALGRDVKKSLGIGILSGVVEPIMALIPAFLTVYLSLSVLPFTMGFAAGAMMYVVSNELIPESHVHDKEFLATLGFLIGFVLMLYLDTVLG